MAISFADAPGNLFNLLGKCGLLISAVDAHQSAQLLNMTDTTNGVVAQLDDESDIQAIVGSAYISILGGVEGACSLAQSVAAAYVNRIVFRDNARLNQNLQSGNVLASLYEIIRQMGVEGATILAQTIGSSTVAFTGNGLTTAIVVSTRRPVDGRVLENTLAETIQLLCSADSFDGGATEGNETISITGQGNQSDVFAFDWPLGSNCQTSVNLIDGNTSNGSGNYLTNSGFSNFTVTNTPDKWVIDVGSAGVNFFRETTLVFDGSTSALRIVGDAGGTLSRMYQVFENSDGTAATLTPLTAYGFNIFMRRDGIAPAAGVLTIELTDNLGNVIQDEIGISNSFTIALTGLTTEYASYSGSFRTPLEMPDAYRIRYRLSTALTNGRSVYMDKASLGLQTQLYTGGPFVSLHSGVLPIEEGNYGYIVTTNSRGAGGTYNTFQTLLARLLPDVLQNEILFPSSTTPTISDTLIS